MVLSVGHMILSVTTLASLLKDRERSGLPMLVT